MDVQEKPALTNLATKRKEKMKWLRRMVERLRLYTTVTLLYYSLME